MTLCVLGTTFSAHGRAGSVILEEMVYWLAPCTFKSVAARFFEQCNARMVRWDTVHVSLASILRAPSGIICTWPMSWQRLSSFCYCCHYCSHSESTLNNRSNSTLRTGPEEKFCLFLLWGGTVFVSRYFGLNSNLT